MAKKEIKKVEVKPVLRTSDPELFTGLARSVEAFDNQGFRNFRIITLNIEHGKVTKVEYSDPYANFEAISRMELWNEMGILNLNNNWQPGKTMCK